MRLALLLLHMQVCKFLFWVLVLGPGGTAAATGVMARNMDRMKADKHIMHSLMLESTSLTQQRYRVTVQLPLIA